MLTNDQKMSLAGVGYLPSEIDAGTIPNATFTEGPRQLKDENFADVQHALAAELRLRDDRLNEFERSKNASTLDIFTSAFAREHSVGSWAARQPMPDFPVDPTYNPVQKSDSGNTDIDGYESWAELFAESTSPEMTAVIKSRINKEMQDRDILDNGGFTGFLASTAAAVTDPINLVTTFIAPEATVGKMVVSSTAAAAVNELALQSTQDTRTAAETVANLMGTALVTGVLGRIANGVDSAQRKAIEEQIVKGIVPNNAVATGPKSVGAAAVGTTGEEVVINGPLSYIAAKMSKITPLGRTLLSKSGTVRSIAQKMVDSGIALKNSYIPTSAESLIRLDYARFDVAALKVRELQRQFVARTGLTSDDFSIKLINAMRQGDVAAEAEVTAAAGTLRKEMDSLWDRAFEAKLAGTGYMAPDGQGGDVWTKVQTTTAGSYMTRRYDLNVIRNDPEGFKRAWANALTEQRQREGVRPLTQSEMYEVTNDIYEKVIKLGDGDLHFASGPSGSAMFSKRVDVKDDFLDDYLVKDWEQLFHGYAKGVSPRVRLSEVFEDNFDLKATIGAVRDEYSNKINAVDKQIDTATNPKEKASLVKQKTELTKELESHVRDLEIMRDRLLNATQEPSWMNPENRGLLSALRAARSWNVVTSLSNILISSIPDLARLITYHGGTKVVKAFVKSAFTKEIKRSNLPSNDLAKLASAMERASTYRLQHVTELEDGIVYTAADKYAHKAADIAMTVTGSKHWNSTVKTIAGYLISDRMGQALIANDRNLLKQMGLTDDMIDVAQDQFKKYGTDDDGLLNLGLDRWSDREVVENIEAFAIKESGRLIVTPSAGDKPILMTTEMGRTIFQFMSFIVAATNKVMLPAAQERGVRPWAEIMVSIGLGSAVYAIKEKIAGREPSEDPAVVLTAAINNTGLAGYAGQLAAMSGSIAGIEPMEQTAKYHSVSGVSKYLGPTAGLAENVLKAVNENTSPDARAKALRKLMPLQNHFILRKGYDEMEKSVAEMIGGSSDVNY